MRGLYRSSVSAAPLTARDGSCDGAEAAAGEQNAKEKVEFIELADGIRILVPTVAGVAEEEQQRQKQQKPTVYIEKVVNAWGSAAGAGSDFFDCYRRTRNVELRRLEKMEEDFQKKVETEEFQLQRHQRLVEAEKKNEAARERRRRRKQKKQEQRAGLRAKAPFAAALRAAHEISSMSPAAAATGSRGAAFADISNKSRLSSGDSSSNNSNNSAGYSNRSSNGMDAFECDRSQEVDRTEETSQSETEEENTFPSAEAADAPIADKIRLEGKLTEKGKGGKMHGVRPQVCREKCGGQGGAEVEEAAEREDAEAKGDSHNKCDATAVWRRRKRRLSVRERQYSLTFTATQPGKLHSEERQQRIAVADATAAVSGDGASIHQREIKEEEERTPKEGSEHTHWPIMKDGMTSIYDGDW